MKENSTALITGASKGLGYALAGSLAKSGWRLLINARNPVNLQKVKNELSIYGEVIAKAGDVKDEIHLMELAEVLSEENWKLDLVVNNASELGVSPLRKLLDHPVENLHRVLHTNMIAPVSLLQKLKPHLNASAKIINMSSDAASETYEKWGAYGGSKAGLDHMTLILGKEYPEFKFYAFDPGDMRTDMHRAAFPGEDISDRPLPEDYAVPALLQIIEGEIPGARYTAHSFEMHRA